MQKFVAAVVALCCISGSSATLINLINQCPYGITAFARSGSSATNSYNLGASGGYQQLDVGPSFPAGLIFASTTGSENNAQVWADRASRVGILRTRCSTCRTGGPCSEPKPARLTSYFCCRPHSWRSPPEPTVATLMIYHLWCVLTSAQRRSLPVPKFSSLPGLLTPCNSAELCNLRRTRLGKFAEVAAIDLVGAMLPDAQSCRVLVH